MVDCGRGRNGRKKKNGRENKRQRWNVSGQWTIDNASGGGKAKDSRIWPGRGEPGQRIRHGILRIARDYILMLPVVTYHGHVIAR